jgi:hypothetical protein
MRFYLDDCAHDTHLVLLLEREGHAVFTPVTEQTRGENDSLHLTTAVGLQAALITKNPNDFEALHRGYLRRGRRHCGILLVYEENVRSKDMDPPDTAEAVQKLLSTGIPIENELHVLNHWR